MPTLEIILRDDAGQAIDGRSVKKYPLDCKMKTFHDIENAVETFKRNALPDIEADLLEAAQKVFIEDKKKTWLVMVPFRSRLKRFMDDLNSMYSDLSTERTQTA